MDDHVLLERIATVAKELVEARPLQATLDHIVHLAVTTVDGCDHASITLVERGTVDTATATDELAGELDELQYRLGDGPCLDAIRERTPLVVENLEQDDRWPGWRERALQHGVRGVAAHRLYVDDDVLGALNLYADDPGAFSADDQRLGVIFSSHAAVAIGCSRVVTQGIEEAEGLREALRSRDVIGQAKGILMERHRIDADDAFALLRERSQHLNVKLRDLAARLADTGDLPSG